MFEDLNEKQQKQVEALESKGYSIDFISGDEIDGYIAYLSKRTKTGAELRQVDETGEIQ